MATWKKIITEADNSNYKNSSLTLTQLDTALDGESGYGANKILKVNSSANAIEWADDTGGIALTDLSVGAEATASGDGAVAYNSSTGVFTYTPPDLHSISGYVANEHIDWTASSAGTVHSSNYTNTTYSEATGSAAGLMSIAHHDKLDDIEPDADVTDTTNVLSALNADWGGSKTFGTQSDDTATFSGNLTVSGNLNVSGATVTTLAETVNVEDNRMLMNSNRTGYPNSDNGSTTSAGIEIERGSASNAYLVWKELGSNSSTANKGKWFLLSPQDAHSGSANSQNHATAAQIQALQTGTSAPGATYKGMWKGALYMDTNNSNLYVCTNHIVDESGGGGG
tara:strand:+ start:9835 stop:10851 length:1017 start_codon:yes stop_codon:yes gene_type:complete